MPAAIKYVQTVSPSRAEGLVKEIYGQAKREIGMLPEPVIMLSTAAELGPASWAAFREPLLAAGAAPRVAKEAVAATVSRLNSCPYCVDAHTIMLYGGGSGDIANQLLQGVPVDELDAELKEVAKWAESAFPAGRPFTAAQAPEFIGVLVYFHFLNRLLNVLVPETFLPGSAKAHKVARKVAGRVLAKRVRALNEPGRSPGVDAVQTRPLPDDLAWAAPNAPIASAFAALADAVERGAVRAVPAATRSAVEDAIAKWDGQHPPLGSAWLDEHLAPLSPAERPAARLALLTAFASYRVTEEDVRAYRVTHTTDADLLDLLAWAAFTAARTIGSRA